MTARFDGSGLATLGGGADGVACLVPALPPTLADFAVRGFRTDELVARAVLERHALAFLDGFNRNRRHWRAPHPSLSEITAGERGFAYEGAAMSAAMVDILTAGRARAVRRLLAGPGDGYRYLVHVGVGWALAKLRLPVPGHHRADPLLRWLAVDGAGFCRTFFDPGRTLRRIGERRPTPQTLLLAQGCGRALWFVEAASIRGVTRRIAAMPPQVRPHLWAGVGLAAVYAGPPPRAGELLDAAGEWVDHVRQGAVFAGTARYATGVVPGGAARTLRELTGLDPMTANRWSAEASVDLRGPQVTIDAYLRWRQRLRDRLRAVTAGDGTRARSAGEGVTP